MASRTRTLCLVLGSLLALSASAQAQNCPLTNLPPSATTAQWTRCRDASQKTCCSDCTDLSIGLNLISANISSMLNAISPVLLDLLKGQDMTFCTVVYPSASCQDNLEQLACAMQCNPDSGKYVQVGWKTRTLTLCKNFTDALTQSCYYAQVLGNTATTNQTFLGDSINPIYFLQALGNIVTAHVGLPHFDLITTNSSEGCYGGPIVAPESHLCCDSLTVPASCPMSSINFATKPNFAPLSGQAIDNTTCRAQWNNFPVGPVTPLSPPPPYPPAPMMGPAYGPAGAPGPLSFNATNTTNKNTPSASYPPPGRRSASASSFLHLGSIILAASLAGLSLVL